VGPDGAANRPFCSPPLTTTKEIGSSTERGGSARVLVDLPVSLNVLLK
jgi:hypothetical protein